MKRKSTPPPLHRATLAEFLAVSDYFATWTDRHPRSERTNATNEHRISRVDKVWSEKEGPTLFNAAGEVVDASGIELSRRSLRNTPATQELEEV